MGCKAALQLGQQTQAKAGARDGAAGEAVYRHFGRAGAAADRIIIARIGDQGGMDQLRKVRPWV